MQRVKEFDKLLLKEEKYQKYGIYIISLIFLILSTRYSPVINLPSQIKIDKFYVKHVVFMGFLIFVSTSSYINMYVYLKRTMERVSISSKTSIYKKLKYCPISKKDIVKSRIIYLTKYLLFITIILSIINFISAFIYEDSKSITSSILVLIINSFLYFILVGFIFGFIPGIFSIILESKDKIIRNKRIDFIMKIIIFLLIFKGFIFLWGICFNQKVEYSLLGVVVTEDAFTDIKKEYWTNFIPNVDKLPKYKDIVYQNHYEQILFFYSEYTEMIVEYDEETYLKEKNNLEKEYVFGDDDNKLPKKYFSIGSYKFRVVQKYKDLECYFPKQFGIVGTSDNKKSIAYLSFKDMDLDSIDNMEDFVKDYFRYNFE